MTDTHQPTMQDQPELSAQEQRAQLEDLIARAAAKDATKDHNAASELYSQATELQAELNGELSPENADLLYAYGKSLYNVAVSKSDVLGSKVAGDPQPLPSSPPTKASSCAGSKSTGERIVKDAITNSKAQGSPSNKATSKELEPAGSKPLFQFTGDENFVDSDSEDGEDGEQADEEDDDDFANAFEVLDLARVLYLKKLSAAEENDEGKGKSTAISTDTKHIKERLADTHDLQAEISLEAERFSDAVADLRTVLELRNSLYSLEDPSVAECHYKLSLALEFASVQQGGEEESGENENNKIDKEMRKEAATQMELAIQSCKVRMAQEEKKLGADTDVDEDKATATKRKIANVKEIIADMEQRLVDLLRPPVSVEQNDQANEAMLKGILGQIVGQSATDQKAQLEAASKGATDLSALVKRKPAKQPTQGSDSATKRPAEEPAADNGSKRSRVDDASS
ncbi:hypothetical protein N7499_009311 [Penicillium canescens]|uniref:Tetratricopeptide SHNi-TPR domain-containing protein n=1 Tax=Penicillium canescens TaxID=5083 RepID=A0AAD6INS2_PENCN|nr:uncharacterized protein N7446_008662 [Penicillium canescens]KAJ5981637.1 hypothetical protein N7522_013265 [Penicillium canescens]KAJ6033041.1 hypothetical protein N7444_010812 [Penicillium canescens]KAJ6057766.1 hypothetical protein N7460_001040 [Penicillium canescens]KAJ6059079.1 hypothetical protein N7446_008662 [Penicillium canescens]KAJ6071297.1 hypothetical protein N7499_009311 [Penicillium canescens]